MIDVPLVIELDGTGGRLSLDTLYLVQVSFTFHLSVKSGAFQGTASFCARKDQIEALHKDLSTAEVISTLDDNDSDAFIRFIPVDHHAVIVEGKLGGSHDDHSMRFKFSAEGPPVQKFARKLLELLEYVDDDESERNYNELSGTDSDDQITDHHDADEHHDEIV